VWVDDLYVSQENSEAIFLQKKRSHDIRLAKFKASMIKRIELAPRRGGRRPNRGYKITFSTETKI